MEAGNLHWGADVTAADTPGDVGLASTVAQHKAQFLGKDALAKSEDKRIGLFAVPETITSLPGAPLVLAGDPVYTDSGDLLGYVTSGAYSFCFNKQLLLVAAAAQGGNSLPTTGKVIFGADSSVLPVELLQRPLAGEGAEGDAVFFYDAG